MDFLCGTAALYHAHSGILSVITGGDSCGIAKSPAEVIYAGEAAAFCNFGNAFVSFCQQLLGFADAKIKNVLFRRGMAGILE